MFGYENRLVFPIYISYQKFKDSMNSLFLFNNNKSYYEYIKGFDRFMFHKTKNKKTKNGFVIVVYSVLVVNMC